MKNKLLYLTVLLFLFTASIYAKTRTSQEALQVVNNFVQNGSGANQNIQKAPSAVKSVQLAYTCNSENNILNTTENAAYYIYNIGTNNGFVVVSGDDRAKTILGYTDSGTFDINAMPENMKYWLSTYESELNALASVPETISSTAELNIPQYINSYATSVAPLLGNIQWNQEAPYNNLCPVVNTTTGQIGYTGCVATAMSQVMKYYNWPLKGTGSNSYITDSLKISLSQDFSNTYYDWANMTDTYSSSSTVAQNNAVATLMYHCGVAVNMNYRPSGSGAFLYQASRALINNFGYDDNIQLLSREFYNKSEWISILKAELNAQRPVIYDGTSTGGGHAFVCDGYDSNDLFHFNWGWGGLYNGYFEISALNPYGLVNELLLSGYNMGQDMIIGIQKPSSDSKSGYNMYINKPMTCGVTKINRNSSFSVKITSLLNVGYKDYTGNIALGLYAADSLYKLISTDYIPLFKVNYSITTDVTGLTIPQTVQTGNYRLYLIYKGENETEWTRVKGKTGTPDYFNIVVSNSEIEINTPSDVLPALTLNSLQTKGSLYQNKNGRFTLNITNNGGEFYSGVGIYMQSVTNSSINQVVCQDMTDIQTGESKTIDLLGLVTVAPGQYYVYAMYDPNNNLDYADASTAVVLGNPIQVEVLAEPTTDNLTLTQLISFPNALKVEKNSTTLTVKIKNSLGFFDRRVAAYIFPLTTGYSVAYLGSQYVYLDQNESATLTFTNSISLDPGNYRAIVFAENKEKTMQVMAPSSYAILPFTLVDNVSALNSNQMSELKFYPNPVVDNLTIDSGELVKSVSICDLLGKDLLIIQPNTVGSVDIPVGNLHSGTYIIRMQTEQKSYVSKFIKL